MALGLTGLLPNIALGLVSILLLVLGAETVVEKMESVARRYRVSGVVIAMTVISLGTSLPEISSHIVASHGILFGNLDYQVASATVLGGNIGSNVVQQTLIMGLIIITAGSLRFSPKIVRRDLLPMVGAHILTLVLVLDGTVSRLDGLLLLGTFSLYMYYLYTTRHEKIFSRGDTEASESPRRDALIALAAMLLVAYSAQVFLQVVETVVTSTGLGGSMIAVVTLGIAAALPELTTALEGLRQGAGGISIGTLIGSNITNPLMGIGLGSAISTYAVPRGLYIWDLPVEIVTGGLIIGYIQLNDEIPFISERIPGDRSIGRIGGALLILVYLFYIYFRFQYFSIDF